VESTLVIKYSPPFLVVEHPVVFVTFAQFRSVVCQMFMVKMEFMSAV